MPAVLLERTVIAVSGEDARDFLQGLVTCDINAVTPQAAAFGALLSPQGKLLFDFFVAADGDRFLLDAPRALGPDLLKRLTFYKLRAKVALTDLSTAENALAVVALLPPHGLAPSGGIAFDDPRVPALGRRAIVRECEAGFATDAPALYERARIAAGVPAGGLDFAYGDVFPHDVNMDLLHGVDFKKGCYVGQEVVSRTQHRALVRRRVRPVEIDGEAAPATPIVAGDVVIGALGGTLAGKGLALLRLDRLQDALDDGRPLTAGAATVRATAPEAGA